MKLIVISILYLTTITTTTTNAQYSSGYRPQHQQQQQQQQNNVQTIYEWNVLEYGFSTAKERQRAIASGNLVPNNGIPIDVAAHYTSNGRLRVFTTIPRFQTGIPYTLATVSERRSGASGPTLQAYPSYEWHNKQGDDCDLITSAFRVAINDCNQMWVIDSGVISGVQYCAPQLLLFDLHTDQLLHRYRFNSSLYTATASLFITPIAVVRDPPPRGRCQQTMVYVADVSNHGLVVYNYAHNTAWRVENKFMYPDPDYGTHTIAGESFNLMDGIFGMSTYKEQLFFHPMASISEYSVPLNVLNNRANWAANAGALPNEFKKLGSRSSECAAEAMDSRGNLFCVTFNPIRLIRWNVNTAYESRNLREVAADAAVLEFVSGMKVVRASNGGEELWLISNRFQKSAAGTQTLTEVNYRILRMPIEEAREAPSYGAPRADLHHKLVFS